MKNEHQRAMSSERWPFYRVGESVCQVVEGSKASKTVQSAMGLACYFLTSCLFILIYSLHGQFDGSRMYNYTLDKLSKKNYQPVLSLWITTDLCLCFTYLFHMISVCAKLENVSQIIDQRENKMKLDCFIIIFIATFIE